MVEMSKKREKIKLIIDILTRGGYHVDVRMLEKNRFWFVNNITQPGKIDKEEKT